MLFNRACFHALLKDKTATHDALFLLARHLANDEVATKTWTRFAKQLDSDDDLKTVRLEPWFAKSKARIADGEKTSSRHGLVAICVPYEAGSEGDCDMLARAKFNCLPGVRGHCGGPYRRPWSRKRHLLAARSAGTSLAQRLGRPYGRAGLQVRHV